MKTEIQRAAANNQCFESQAARRLTTSTLFSIFLHSKERLSNKMSTVTWMEVTYPMKVTLPSRFTDQRRAFMEDEKSKVWSDLCKPMKRSKVVSTPKTTFLD